MHRNLELRKAILTTHIDGQDDGELPTIRKFAEKVGKPAYIVSWVLAGRWNLKPEEQELWSKVLNRKPEELFPND
jgi:hypothetical protein